MSSSDPRAIGHPVRDAVARVLATVGLLAFALIHILDLPDTMNATPYIGWMYIGLIVSAVGLAGAFLRSGDSRLWRAASGLVVAVMIGYVLSRTTGLPQSTDDIGNWGQSLGMAMLFVGTSFLGLSASVLADRRSPKRARRAPVRVAGAHERQGMRLSA